jgi:hypothetical protein
MDRDAEDQLTTWAAAFRPTGDATLRDVEDLFPELGAELRATLTVILAGDNGPSQPRNARILIGSGRLRAIVDGESCETECDDTPESVRAALVSTAHALAEARTEWESPGVSD